jgi:hypothetical protein
VYLLVLALIGKLRSSTHRGFSLKSQSLLLVFPTHIPIFLFAR